MLHIPINSYRSQRRKQDKNVRHREEMHWREKRFSYCCKRLSDRQTERGRASAWAADVTVAEGNPPPASLTFSSEPHCLTMPVPFTSFTVKGIPLRSALVAPSYLLRLHHISVYPGVFALKNADTFKWGRTIFFQCIFFFTVH